MAGPGAGGQIGEAIGRFLRKMNARLAANLSLPAAFRKIGRGHAEDGPDAIRMLQIPRARSARGRRVNQTRSRDHESR